MKDFITNYIFNSVDKKITFVDFNEIKIESILYILNQTTGAQIFLSTDTLSFGGDVLDNVLTFSVSNIGMLDTDKLLIIIGISQNVTDTILVPNIVGTDTIIDMSNYGGAFIQIGTGAGGWSGRFDFYVCNDLTSLYSTKVTNVYLNTLVDAAVNNGIFSLNTKCKYIVLRRSSATGGVAKLVITRKANPSPEMLSNVTLVGTNNVKVTDPISLAASSTISLIPSASNGASNHHRRVSTNDTNNVVVKSSVVSISHIEVFNNSYNVRYLKIYNKSSAPIIASDSALIVKIIMIPVNGGLVINGAGIGIKLNAGLSYTIVGGIADTDTTPANANEVIVNISYT